MKRTPATSTDEQTTTPSDLATKVAGLFDDMKTVLDWIKAQFAAPSEMPRRKSNLLSRTPPPKAHMMLTKGIAENISGARDDDVSMAPSLAEERP